VSVGEGGEIGLPFPRFWKIPVFGICIENTFSLVFLFKNKNKIKQQNCPLI